MHYLFFSKTNMQSRLSHINLVFNKINPQKPIPSSLLTKAEAKVHKTRSKDSYATSIFDFSKHNHMHTFIYNQRNHLIKHPLDFYQRSQKPFSKFSRNLNMHASFQVYKLQLLLTTIHYWFHGQKSTLSL